MPDQSNNGQSMVDQNTAGHSTVGKVTRHNNVETGFFGQEIAQNFLCGKGMLLLESNFRMPTAEIDLIMRDGSYIVFVEVKYRKSLKYGLPREAVGIHKQRRIIKAALYYIARHGLQDQCFRFDVLELLETTGCVEVNHIENAFGV